MSRFAQKTPAEEKVLRAENSQILHQLQSSLTNASLVDLSLSGHTTERQAEADNLSPLHQILICGTFVLPLLCQFWEKLREKLASEGPYQQAGIGGLRLQLSELQAEDPEAREIRHQGLREGWEDIDGVLHWKDLLYLSRIIRTEIISRHHNNPLAGHFGIEKTRELAAQKYYWPTLRADIEAYVKGCDVCITSKAVRQKFYGNL